MTRSAISGRLGVNRSTVAALVAELASAGMVREVGGASGAVGRPSLVVEPVSTSAAVIAFDMRVERVVAALIGLGGELLCERERRPQADGLSPAEAVATLTDLTVELTLEYSQVPVVGVTVAVPGLVRRHDGMVVLAPNLGWQDIPLGSLLSDSLLGRSRSSPTVQVGNDADLGVTAEHRRGAAAGARNVIFLSGEVGVGGGVVVDGHVMVGGMGFGGEVGHMVVNPNGRPCRCGSRGCWETEIGRSAVLAAAGLDTLVGDVPDLRAAASGGTSRQRIEMVAQWLGLGLANLINIFNPEVIVLGGHLRVLHQATADVVDRHMSTALSASRRDVRLVYPHFGRRSALTGAAEMAFDHLLYDPLGAVSLASRAS